MTTRIYVTTTARDTPDRPWATANFGRVMRAAEESDSSDYVACDTAANADVILFVEAGERFSGDILRSPLYRRYRGERCYVFDSSDSPLPVLPGMYVNVPATYRRTATVVGSFYIRVFDNTLFDEVDNTELPSLLFSFVGKVGNYPGLRSRVLALEHPRAYVRDMGSGQSDNDIGYVRTIKRSEFVLCPRGIGVSTWRMFETMRAGRVPVIISDQWRPPRDLDWENCSVCVAERDVEKIPKLLEDLEPRAADMGRNAHEAWQRNFSRRAAFGYIGRQLAGISKALPSEPPPGMGARLKELIDAGALVKFGKHHLRSLVLGR